MNRSAFAFVMALGFGVLALTAQHAFSYERLTSAPWEAVLHHVFER